LILGGESNGHHCFPFLVAFEDHESLLGGAQLTNSVVSYRYNQMYCSLGMQLTYYVFLSGHIIEVKR
jgi:hypothetical protein